MEAPPPSASSEPTGQPRGRLLCTRRRLLGAGILAAAGAMTYGTWEADQLETNIVELPEAALPGMAGLRILHFSDLHNDWTLMAEILRRTPALRPDIIVFTGDLITDFERLMRTRTIILQLRELAQMAPVYACIGNHDMNKLEQVERIFRAAGVRLLRNEAVIWQSPDGTALRIAGIGDWTEGDEDPARCLQPSGSDDEARLPTLVLSHNPDSREVLKNYSWDLMLAGHTHGGQIGNPFTGKCLTWNATMVAGLYPYEGRRIFVTKGVGNIGGARFFCAPEINLLLIGERVGA